MSLKARSDQEANNNNNNNRKKIMSNCIAAEAAAAAASALATSTTTATTIATSTTTVATTTIIMASSQQQQQQQANHARNFDTDGLILPQKVQNPCTESREKKDLHREMLWKMKYGSDNPRDCELRQAYAHRANRQRLKAIESEQTESRVQFERLLETQKQRLHSIHSSGERKTKSEITGGATTPGADKVNVQHMNYIAAANDNNNLQHHQHHLTDHDNHSHHTSGENDEFYRIFSKVARSRSTGITAEPTRSAD